MKASERVDWTSRSEPLRSIAGASRPSFCYSDIWKAPLHDFPIRDEIVYQYLPLSPDMVVLEVGPGSGFTAFRLARRLRHMILVDVAPAAIDYLNLALKEVPNLTVICADVCAPNFVESVRTQVHAVFGLEVFELLPDPGSCLKNLATVLHRGGSLVLQFPNYPPPKSPGVTYFRTRQELSRMLAAAGFERWEIYALRLRPHARIIYQLHEGPLRLYRRLRRSADRGKPLTYDRSWAFQERQRLEHYKFFLHGAWTAMFAALRLGGACFERTPVGDEILNRNLLLVASR